jgi:surface carbohydrate biosynthesis protein
MRPEKIYICPSIFYYFLKSLRFFDWHALKIQKRKVRAAIGQLLRYYRMGSFFVMKPKVVITVVDNSGDFHWLCKNYKGAIFFAIQCGHRTNIQLAEGLTKQYLTNFFCFGNYEKDRYSKFQHTALNCYPVGSLRLGIYQEYFKESMTIDYDIAIISQYRKHVFLNTSHDPLKKPQVLMHQILSNYVKENVIKAAIVLVTNGDKEEIDFYKNIYQDSADFLANDKNKLSAYSAIDQCNVILGFNSTLISEAIGMGKKVLRVDFMGSNDQNDYDQTILLKNPSYSELESRLNELLAEPYEDYRKRMKGYACYIMNYNPDCPAHEAIRKKIKEYL